jgi:DNA-binding NarL/FixJ family response regulator
MGGEQCLRKLLAIDPSVRVLVASGYAVDSQSEDVLRAGARAFVSKPYHLDELARRVRQVLDE